MDKILIALDYSPAAQIVAEAGYALAKTMQAEVTLLHVISDPMYYTLADHVKIMGFTGHKEARPLQVENAEDMKNTSLLFLNKIKQYLGNETIQILLNEGDFADCILKTAKELHSNIIVMGSHSRRWLENIVMGSVTEKVLHLTSIPLYIIPTKRQN